LKATSRVDHKKDAKKKNLLGKDSQNKVESSSDVDENIFFTSMHKDLNISSLHHKKEKELKKLFHIKIQVKIQR
jgi:hypothetical protein